MTAALKLSGSLVALVTPMKAGTHEIDEVAFVNLVEWQLEAGIQGLIILGTTGESPTVTAEERERLLKLAVKTASGRVPVIAGVGTSSTAATVAAAKAAERLGVDALLVVTPYYNKPPQRGLVQHYAAVHDATDKPIILYNVPGRTACDLTLETVVALSQYERIVALKDASGELARVRQLRQALPPGFALLSGNDDSACEFILAGGDGVISVTANVMPAAMVSMTQSALAGVEAQARDKNKALSALHEALFLEANPIGVKAALQMMGKIDAGIRLPLVNLAPDLMAQLKQCLKGVGALRS